jgi:hypothetical protein
MMPMGGLSPAVVKNQIDLVVGVVQCDAVLPPDKGETLAQRQ